MEVIQVDGEDVLIIRRGDEVFAIAAHCTHYNGPLAEGLLDGDQIHCPWHHACFDIRTGEALRAPALLPVATYDVEVRDGKVVVGGKRGPHPASGHPLPQVGEGFPTTKRNSRKSMTRSRSSRRASRRPRGSASATTCCFVPRRFIGMGSG